MSIASGEGQSDFEKIGLIDYSGASCEMSSASFSGVVVNVAVLNFLHDLGGGGASSRYHLWIRW